MGLTEVRSREFSLRDILTSSWSIFNDRFSTIGVITLLIYIPINIVLAFVSIDTLVEREGLFRGFKLYLQIARLLEGLIGVLATMAIAYVVERLLAGEKIEYSPAMKKSLSRWKSVIWTGIVAGAIILGFTLLLIVPGIIWSVYYLFFIMVVALRDKRGKAALDYSKSLVKGKWWRVVGISLGLGIIQIAAYAVIEIPFLFTPDGAVMDVISGTLMDLASSFFTVAATVFFLNLEYLKTIQASAAEIAAPGGVAN